MEIQLTPKEFIEIREFLKETCGIFLEKDKEYLVKTRLFELLREVDGNFSQLLEWAFTNQKGMKQKLIHLLTTHETFWFRDQSLWNTLQKHILPQLWTQKKPGEQIHIWCAGCSTGQEPYSIAILIDEFCKQRQLASEVDRFSILATDISLDVLEKAKHAHYNDFDLRRGLSESRVRLYFSQSGEYWKLQPTIAERVQFQPLNLIEDFTRSMRRFHLILCRNVLIYFALEFKDPVLSKMANLLYSGGFLFLGASEYIENSHASLKKEEFEEGKYYRKEEL